MIASKNARKFSRILSFPKLILPIPERRVPVLSTLNSTFPPFRSRTAFPTSNVTVPTFGFGINPLGPRIFPIFPTAPIISGVATALSKSNHPPWIFATRSSEPTMSAPASWASFSFSPLANTTIRIFFPVPFGSTTEPRTCWSGYFGSTPSRIATSTVSSNLACAVPCSRSSASSREYFDSLFTFFRDSRYFFPRFGLSLSLLSQGSDDFQPHAPGRSLDGLDRGGQVLDVQINHLEFCDLLDLGAGNRPAILPLGRLASFLDPCGLQQENRRGGGLREEGERPVRVDGDDHRDDHPFLGGRLRVEGLAELHDVDPVLSEGGTHRGGRIRLSRRDLELDLRDDFLRHDVSSPVRLAFLDLGEIELHGRCPPEDGDEDDHFPLVRLDAVHDPVEIREGPVGDTHVLPFGEGHLRLRLEASLRHLGLDVLDLRYGDGRRVLPADEPGHLGGVPDQVPGLLVLIHLDEKVSREKAARARALLPLLHLHHGLGGDQHVPEPFLDPFRLDPVLERFLHFFLIPRIGMNHVPLSPHGTL